VKDFPLPGHNCWLCGHEEGTLAILLTWLGRDGQGALFNVARDHFFPFAA
jgi:hypothetical protein